MARFVGITFCIAVSVTLFAGCRTLGVQPGGDASGSKAAVDGALSDFGKAISVTDADVRLMASNFAKQSDTDNKIAPPQSVYAKRLVKLTSKMMEFDGMKLDYKVYMADTVNAFAMADGTVRVYSGLMDLMTDDELRFVIGHEIAHVKLGHSTAAVKTAYLTSAATNGLAAYALSTQGGAKVVKLGGEQLKALFNKALNAAHSRGQESDADAYSVQFMKANKIPTQAASTALLKLASQAGAHSVSILSSHPDPKERAQAVEKIAGN